MPLTSFLCLLIALYIVYNLCDTSLSLYHHCNPSQAYISDKDREQLDQWQLPFFFLFCFFSFFFSPLLFVVCCFRSFSYLLSRWFLLRVDRAFTAASSLKGSCSLKFRENFKKVIKTVSQQLSYNFLFLGLGSAVHFTFNCLIKKSLLSLSLSLSLPFRWLQPIDEPKPPNHQRHHPQQLSPRIAGKPCAGDDR
jgi:hypothetical protein